MSLDKNEKACISGDARRDEKRIFWNSLSSSESPQNQIKVKVDFDLGIDNDKPLRLHSRSLRDEIRLDSDRDENKFKCATLLGDRYRRKFQNCFALQYLGLFIGIILLSEGLSNRISKSVEGEKDFLKLSKRCVITDMLFQKTVGVEGRNHTCSDSYIYIFEADPLHETYLGGGDDDGDKITDGEEENDIPWLSAGIFESKVHSSTRIEKDCTNTTADPIYSKGDQVICWRPRKACLGDENCLQKYKCGNDDCMKIFPPKDDIEKEEIDGTDFLIIGGIVIGSFLFLLIATYFAGFISKRNDCNILCCSGSIFKKFKRKTRPESIQRNNIIDGDGDKSTDNNVEGDIMDQSLLPVFQSQHLDIDPSALPVFQLRNSSLRDKESPKSQIEPQYSKGSIESYASQSSVLSRGKSLSVGFIDKM